MFFQLELGARRAARAGRSHPRRAGAASARSADRRAAEPRAAVPARVRAGAGPARHARAGPRGRADAARRDALAGAAVERQPRPASRTPAASRTSTPGCVRAWTSCSTRASCRARRRPWWTSARTRRAGTGRCFERALYRGRRWYGPSNERSEPGLLPEAGHRGRSGDRRGAEGRGGAPGAHARDDRVRELRSAVGARLPGLGAHQQVRRGLSGAALLRRLRVRGHRRAARDRPGEGALRRRPRRTCSRTRARRRTRPSTWRCSSRATASSA